MSDNTKIEWCDHSWSPWEGCTKISPGCANCYAEEINARFSKGANWGKGKPRRMTKDWTKPVKWNKAAGVPVAVNWDCCDDCGKPAKAYYRPKVFPSVCDWLDDEVPIEWLARFLALIHDTPNLDWLLLTKRPENFEERMLRALAHTEGIDYETADAWEGFAATELGQWLNDWTSYDATPPRNVWIGTSVEDQTRADERIPALLKIPAKVRFLSAEPLLGSLDISGWLTHDWKPAVQIGEEVPRIEWVIIGGESGRNARPCNVSWVRSIVKQCATACVPCFVKQLGRKPEVEAPSGGWMQPVPTRDAKGGDPSEWPKDLRGRQFPEVKP